MLSRIEEFISVYRLKNLKSSVGRDGHSWSASIYKNGKRIGTIADDGNGGPVNLYITSEEELELRNYAKGLLPNITREHAEYFVSCLMSVEEALKAIKRRIKKGEVVMMEKSDFCEDGLITSFSAWNTPYTEANKEIILKKHPTAVFLNDIADKI